MTRRFVIIGQDASASPEFSLVDLPGTSGRLDVLLRCLRAALLVSHGVRHDSMVYLVLMGGASAPRTLRIDGHHVRFVRPDERMLALLVQKALLRAPSLELESAPLRFFDIRPGLALAKGGLDAVLADVGDAPSRYVLDEQGRDVRKEPLASDAVVFVGDHRGFSEDVSAKLAEIGVTSLAIGPVSLHADDAITILHNEWDRS